MKGKTVLYQFKNQIPHTLIVVTKVLDLELKTEVQANTSAKISHFESQNMLPDAHFSHLASFLVNQRVSFSQELYSD